jgi:spoIIIJ-associated protein
LFSFEVTMNQEKMSLEIIAPSVDEAVANGLAQLGLSRDRVDIEILDSGTRGLFGLGSRQARVRLSIHSDSAVPTFIENAEFEEKPTEKVEEKPKKEVPAKVPVSAILGDDDTLEVAQAVVSELLEKMRVNAKVTATLQPPQEGDDQPIVKVEVEGDDLSILIGRRSETLNALQYISSLIIGKELERWVPLIIDVQGYRERRERQLRQLAQRMAEQAIHTGRRQVLEPMPASERRMIHLELRDHPLVMTESVGEEPNRKITILPKK